MNEKDLKKILEDVRLKKLDVETAFKRLKDWPAEDIGYAVIDHHRELRKGFPEVIFAEGKEKEDVLEIFERMFLRGTDVLVTRVSTALAKAITGRYEKARYNRRAGTVTLQQRTETILKGKVVVIAAGTSDVPVAEEARETAQIMGSHVESAYDVGVAGLHRLIGRNEDFKNARVLVVVAGMDGALASVVGGLYPMPVIAVPTSIGYGASFGGLAPLLAMLNCCAPGVTVVNIDNGFGAGYMAHMINYIGENRK